MTDGTRAIEPALTAEEWKAMRAERPRGDHAGQRWYEVGISQHGNVFVRENFTTPHERFTDGYLGAAPPMLAAELMALANAALPDGDPRKITREDVNELLSIASNDDHPATIHDEQLRQIAAKLAALLPPEG